MKDMELDKMNPNINAEIKKQAEEVKALGVCDYCGKRARLFKFSSTPDPIWKIGKSVILLLLCAKCYAKWEKIEMSTRNYCELCGAKLSKPETDLSKTAVCNKCLEKQFAK